MATQSQLETYYHDLLLIRRFEERIAEIYPTDVVKSPIHLSIGQEAPSVALCQSLKPEDTLFGTYRGHAMYIARGGDLRAMAAELYGKVDGCARGKAGSMHLGALDQGMMFTSAIVGTGVPNAMGYAFAKKSRKEAGIVACVIGDGAVDEGAWAESMNFSSLRQLPVLWVVENNLYAIHAPLKTRMPTPNFCQRAEAYGIATSRIDAQDVTLMAEGFASAAQQVRTTGRPHFVEIATYRWREHVGPNQDLHLGYRSAEEMEQWKATDPLMKCAAQLPQEALDRIDRIVREKIDDALAYAEASSYPGDEELLQYVYSEKAEGTHA